MRARNAFLFTLATLLSSTKSTHEDDHTYLNCTVPFPGGESRAEHNMTTRSKQGEDEERANDQDRIKKSQETDGGAELHLPTPEWKRVGKQN